MTVINMVNAEQILHMDYDSGESKNGERGDGFSDLRVQSVAVQSCFTNNRSQQ